MFGNSNHQVEVVSRRVDQRHGFGVQILYDPRFVSIVILSYLETVTKSIVRIGKKCDLNST